MFAGLHRTRSVSMCTITQRMHWNSHHRKPVIDMNADRLNYSSRIATIFIQRFPFQDPLERRFYSKDGHQWNHSETATPKNMNICNIMNILMTLDQTANEKNIKMVLCKFIQSRLMEMPRDTGSWITMNHVHMHCTHSLQLTAQTVLVYVRVSGNYKIHCNVRGIPFQNFVLIVLVYGIGSITLYLSISSC